MKSIETRAGINSFRNFSGGVRLASPLLLGYAPAGFAFGVLAGEAGMTAAETAFMSFFVYAGSAQFIAIAQIAAGAPVAIIAATCGIVNLRYMLMSASIAKRFSLLPFLHKFLFAFHLTDETFALHSARTEGKTPEENASPAMRCETLGIGVPAHLTWLITSMLGFLFGVLLGDVTRYGIDFALAGVFIALLAPRLRDKRQAAVALLAGMFSLTFSFLGFDSWSVVVATAAAASIGLLLP